LLANRIRNAVGQYRSEKRLSETRKEYTTIFENAQNALLLIDVEDGGFRYRQCNPRAIELIGRDRTEVVGERPREALGPENGTKVVGAYRKCVQQLEPVAYTVTLDLPVGRVIRDCEVTPVSSDGEIEKLVAEFRDVTEQHQRQRDLERTARQREERRRELKEEQRFIEQALDTLDNLVYVLDTDGTLRRWNSQLPELTGYTDDDLTGMQVVELFPEDEREAIADSIATTLADGQCKLEADLRTAGGERLPCEFTGAQLTDKEGNVTGLVGVGRDLTKRRQRERRFQALVEESKDIISIIDTDGVFQYQSPAVERILGYEPKATIGDTAWEYIHPDDRVHLESTFQEWVATPEATETVEYRARHADGSWRWLEANGNNQLDNPAVEGYIVNSRDITERKTYEQELKAVSSQYQTLVENFPDGAVFLFDTELEYVRAGGQELMAVGLSPEEVAGTQPRDLFPEEIADETVQYYQETVDGASHTFKQEYGGQQYRIQTTPVRTDDGEIIYGLALSQNVTEETERREELERQNERLEEFASIVSHDLRNPLRVADGRLELIRDECASDHIDDVAQALDRMDALIEDLLTLAREGNQVAAVEPVELANVAQNGWQTVEMQQATLDADTPQVIEADRSRIKQLFENLYRNAIEHGGDDVIVSVGAIDDGFYVADTGPGIRESDREDVFEAGYSTNENGTGFGLRIVEQIVDAHGWEITVTESEEGGARFEITGVKKSA